MNQKKYDERYLRKVSSSENTFLRSIGTAIY